MVNRRTLFQSGAAVAMLSGLPAWAKYSRTRVGAPVPWTTYEAQDMKTTGTVLAPQYGPHLVQMECFRQSCVKLAAEGEYVEFTVRAPANTMVIRYCLPDSADGTGIDSALDLYRNGALLRRIPVTSRFTWLYGDYPFTNNPKDGKNRHFFDDVRLKGLDLVAGDVIRLQKPKDAAEYCIIDLVDLEKIAPPLPRPANSLSIADFGADNTGQSDSTEAVRACLAQAAARGLIAWIPAGDFKLTGDIVPPSNVTLQGAGMWHATFVGDEDLYGHADRRLRFKLTGNDIHLADFALLGKVKYRNDSEQNDGVFGAHARDCTVSRLWVEHTKVGMWFYVCNNVVIDGCRMRNTLADGINLCVDTRNCVVQNSSARNTGDDCFAIWPSPSDQGFTQEAGAPGNNVIRHCTGQMPFLAQGGAIYGGASNRIENCLFTDIASGCGILISTTFPTFDEKNDNNFSGTTVVRDCELIRCGGYDHGWTWRAALQICLQRRDISGLKIQNVKIQDSLSDGVSVVTAGDTPRVLSRVRLDHVQVSRFGVGAPASHGLWVAANAAGGMTIAGSNIPQIRNDSAVFSIRRD
jgi:hypothetical protein